MRILTQKNEKDIFFGKYFLEKKTYPVIVIGINAILLIQKEWNLARLPRDFVCFYAFSLIKKRKMLIFSISNLIFFIKNRTLVTVSAHRHDFAQSELTLHKLKCDCVQTA